MANNVISSALGNTIPSGSMLPFAGTTPPQGWLLAQGQAVSRSQYPELFAAIGTTWGIGDGSTTFNLPDMRAAAPVGAGTSDKYTQNETKTLGQYENDQFQGHWHSSDVGLVYTNTSDNGGVGPGNFESTSYIDYVKDPISDGTNGTPRTGNTTRGKQVVVNYIIKS